MVKYKKWVISVIVSYFGILLCITGLVYYIDPFFHFHAPYKGVSYVFGNEQYSNDGIVRNFSYDAIITGTSMTENFKTQQVDELFQVKSIRTSFMGEGYKRVSENLDNAIKNNDELKMVIRSLDTLWLIADKDWMGYDYYPEYLYDDNIWNDVNYIFNRDILINNVLPVLKRSLEGIPPETFDSNVFGAGFAGGKETVLKNYERPDRKYEAINSSDTEMFMSFAKSSIEQNIINTVKANPNITFYLFFPPYSICWWDSINQEGPGVLQRRIDLEQLTIELLLDYNNVKLFSFFNNYELICNLNNYMDSIHYIQDVNSQILVWMKNGKYQLTKDNYKKYLEEISVFYNNYNYDQLFK